MLIIMHDNFVEVYEVIQLADIMFYKLNIRFDN